MAEEVREVQSIRAQFILLLLNAILSPFSYWLMTSQRGTTTATNASEVCSTNCLSRCQEHRTLCSPILFGAKISLIRKYIPLSVFMV